MSIDHETRIEKLEEKVKTLEDLARELTEEVFNLKEEQQKKYMMNISN